MAAVSRSDHARPAAPMTAADLEAAIAALPGRKQRLRESFDRLVARAPLDFHLPFAWDDIDAHVSSLHASLSLRFRQIQQQQPHPSVPLPATAAHDDEQPRPGTATPEDEQAHPGATVSAAHDDDESIQEDEEMVSKDEEASPVQEDDDVGEDREDADMGFEGAPCCHAAGGTRDQEFPMPVHARPDAGNPMLRQQPYMAFPPDVLSQLNLPMLQRQQPYMPYQQEFPAMAVAMNSYNIPPMVQQQPYFNIPLMVQQPPYFRQEFFPDFSKEFFPDFSQEFFPDVMRQAPMPIDHVLRQQYMAMAHHQPYFPQQQYMVIAQHQPYFPQQQYMAQHEHHFPVAHAASSAHGQGSKAKRGRWCSTTGTDAINVLADEACKKSRTVCKHDAKPEPNYEPIQKKTIYDYF